MLLWVFETLNTLCNADGNGFLTLFYGGGNFFFFLWHSFLALEGKPSSFQASTVRALWLVQNSTEKTDNSIASFALQSLWLLDHGGIIVAYASMLHGILFNHEARSVVNLLPTIPVALQYQALITGLLILGNLDAYVIGACKDYVEMPWLMLLQETAETLLSLPACKYSCRIS